MFDQWSRNPNFRKLWSTLLCSLINYSCQLSVGIWHLTSPKRHRHVTRYFKGKKAALFSSFLKSTPFLLSNLIKALVHSPQHMKFCYPLDNALCYFWTMLHYTANVQVVKSTTFIYVPSARCALVAFIIFDICTHLTDVMRLKYWYI